MVWRVKEVASGQMPDWPLAFDHEVGVGTGKGLEGLGGCAWIDSLSLSLSLYVALSLSRSLASSLFLSFSFSLTVSLALSTDRERHGSSWRLVSFPRTRNLVVRGLGFDVLGLGFGVEGLGSRI